MKLRVAVWGVVGSCALAGAAEPGWPQFRGPAGAGVAAGQKPPVQVAPTTNVAWKVPCPAGFSSPVVIGDKLILTGFEAGKLFTFAVSRADGKELWRADAGATAIEPYHKTEGSPAASSVVTDGERVVAYFGSCGLRAYDLAGKELWRYDLQTAATNNDFGTGVSPILADGKVILVRDLSKDSTLLAIDAKTGSKAWETPRTGFPTSYSTPTIWHTPQGKQLVVPGATKLSGYDPASGKLIWTVSGLAAVGCTTPVQVGENLVYAAWSPGGSAEFQMPAFDDLLKSDADKDGALNAAESESTFLKGFFESNDLNKDGKITRDEWDGQIQFMKTGKNVAVAVKPGGTGDITATHVAWKITKGLPYVPSPLVYDGQMYTVNMRGLLSAHEAATGKEVFADENVGLTGVYASPIAANGHVYLFGLDGTALVLKAGDFPQVVHRAKFGERIAATPAVADDTLYVRTAKNLYAFSAKK